MATAASSAGEIAQNLLTADEAERYERARRVTQSNTYYFNSQQSTLSITISLATRKI